ncbi:MAG: hypothetical protein WCS88_03570 [Patescibacteria group bacterium]|jgi:hypothetical protein
MSFWKNLFGNSQKETQIIEEPEHDLAMAPPDDLMVIKDKKQTESNTSDYKKEDLNNKDSP